MNWESNVETYITMCKTDNEEGGFAVYNTERLKREGIFVNLELIHIVEWQKPAQCCRAIILQLKIKKKKRNLVCFAYCSPPALSSHCFPFSVFGFPYSGHVCINGIVTLQCVAFCFWLLSFRIKSTGSFCAIADFSVIFIFMTEEYFMVWIYHILFIHSSVDPHLYCVYLLAIRDNVAIRICLYILFLHRCNTQVSGKLFY